MSGDCAVIKSISIKNDEVTDISYFPYSFLHMIPIS